MNPQQKTNDLFDGMGQLYSYDFREMSGWVIGLDGLSPAIECFEELWDVLSRYPHLLKIDTVPAGCAIVRRIGEDGFDMEQFFTLRNYRRSGVGSDAAQMLFRAFSGRWTVEQIAINKAAQLFWRKVISDYTNGDFDDTNGADPILLLNS